MSLMLLSQNSQAAGMPSAIVVLFILYDRLRTAFASLGNRDVAPWLLTLLLFPLFAVGGYAASIAGYHAYAHDRARRVRRRAHQPQWPCSARAARAAPF